MPVVLLLRGAQRRDAGGTLPPGRKLGHPVIDLAGRRLREQLQLAHQRRAAHAHTAALVAHRSTSPKTMSWVPITATTSAIMWPLHISSSEARCAKPGARHFRR